MFKFLTILLIVFYVYTVLSTIILIIMENRNPVKSLSWLLVLIFLPVIGLILYFIIGQDYRKRKWISLKSIQRITQRPCASFDINQLDEMEMPDNHFHKLIHLLKNNSEADAYVKNKIEVFSDGKKIFESIFESIRNAHDHIHIEFFIFEDDKISNQLRELLIQKAKEGVRVRMIYDYLGSFHLSKKYLQSLRDAGVYAKPFLPLRFRIRRTKINYRNHRKIIVVDGKIGYTGGVNIADRYIYGNNLGVWRDTMVKIQGSGVHGIQKQFLIDWYFVDRKLITDKKYFPTPLEFDNNVVQFVTSGPDTDWANIMQGICAAIFSAQKYVYIHTPYFMPNDLVSGCMQMAALSGTEIRLILPEKSDAPLSDYSSSTYLGEMLDAGVRVFKYQKGVLHSKAIVIDDFLSIVGSTNFDDRSFEQNFEANAFIYDEETAFQLKELFVNDLEFCKELTKEEWYNRPRSQKLKESFARLFSPLM